MDEVECVVAGAGVIGLAAARALALRGREVLLLEAAGAVGTGASSRNSEVIHAGIYYPAGSLMARTCVAGRRALHEYCGERGIGHRRCGKLVVAVEPDEAERLDAIRTRAEANGVEGLRLLTGEQARRLEPALRCRAALLSPESGIVDSHQLMLSLLGDLEAAGGMLALRAPLRQAMVVPGGFALTVGPDATRLRCATLVNAAGLLAPALARRIEGLPAESIPRAWFCKGSYFSLAGRCPFERLIYPVPVPGGLGTHLTLDLVGRARFGPDVEWVDEIDYAVDPARAGRIEAAVRRYFPGLPEGALQPDYSGIRAKIVPPEVAVQDFRLDGPDVHGVPGLINLFGIESPGLTACLALADVVAQRVR